MAIDTVWCVVGMLNGLDNLGFLTQLSSIRLMLQSNRASRFVFILTSMLSITAVVVS